MKVGYIYKFDDRPPLKGGPGHHYYIVIYFNDLHAEMLQFTSTNNEEGTFFSRGGEIDF